MADAQHIGKSSGVVTNDPARELPVGSTLKFQPKPILGDIPEGAASLRNWQFFEGILLQVAFVGPHLHRVEGLGVLIAPGLALCASHVIDPHIDQLLVGSEVATCSGITTHGLQIWNIRKITKVSNTDVSILGLELCSALPPEHTFFQSIITTRTPAIGELLTICGFRAAESGFPKLDRGVDAAGEVWVCKGSVSQAFPTGRDRSMIPWPVLEVSVSAHGGMSGGPVYDQHGLLVGLLCSSVDCGEENGISYVSLLWPALVSRFEGTWPRGFYKATQSLLELDPRVCGIDKREAIIASYDAAGKIHAEYREW